jgi:hypothetical protein
MASYKDYKSISAAKKAGSIYYMNKQGKKMLAVTKEDLDLGRKRTKVSTKVLLLQLGLTQKVKTLVVLRHLQRNLKHVQVQPRMLSQLKNYLLLLLYQLKVNKLKKALESESLDLSK